MMSFFSDVALAPADPILGLALAFHCDPRKEKVNLGVGLYKTEELRTPVLRAVKAAEEALLREESSKEYLPIEGDPLFIAQAGALIFGEHAWKGNRERIAAFQTVGGTGALKIGGAFLKEAVDSTVWISEPTWPNHRGVFASCKFPVEHYPYYDAKHHRVHFSALYACLEKLPEKTIVVLHASCHNPTACDPTSEEWKLLCALFKSKRLIPFFDCAYQGFGQGLEQDVEPIRLFLKSGMEMCVATSCAKNFSLYGERVGALFIIAESASIAERIFSRVKQIVRTTYSNPPMHGAKIVGHVLSVPALRTEWMQELTEMRTRITAMRSCLYQRLKEHQRTDAFHPLSQGNGMFGYTGLQKNQVERMIREYGIYMTSDGRINVCGLNQKNLDYVVKAMLAVS